MQTSSRLDLASLREGSLTLYSIYYRGGGATYLYWSLSQPILVTESTYIGPRRDLYWSERQPI